MSEPRPRLVVVAAMAHDRVIGQAGGMPWHLPADLKHFKSLTLGHPVIMGRRTFDAIGRALPGRINVVVSRSRPALPAGVVVCAGLEQALTSVAGATDAMIIGGGEIYAQALPMADRLELTLIDAELAGDTRFPEFDLAAWRLSSVRTRPPDSANPYRLTFVSLERRGRGRGA